MRFRCSEPPHVDFAFQSRQPLLKSWAMQLLYHYCSTHSFLEILKSKTLRLGNVLLMNDYKELQWFNDLCIQVVGDVEKTPRPEALPDRDKFLFRLRKILGQPKFDHIYASCFSRSVDDLSQWRGYADDGKGVCFGINADTLKEVHRKLVESTPIETNLYRRIDYELKDVIYDVTVAKSQASQLIEEYLKPATSESPANSIIDANMAAYDIRRESAFFKNPAFASEREVRLVAMTSITGNAVDPAEPPEICDNLPSAVDFYYGRAGITPFVSVPFLASCILQVWVGPGFGNSFEVDALRLFLRSEGVDAPVARDVRRSSASYRC